MKRLRDVFNFGPSAARIAALQRLLRTFLEMWALQSSFLQLQHLMNAKLNLEVLEINDVWEEWQDWPAKINGSPPDVLMNFEV